MKILREFKQFAMRGSVVDLAVGIIVGAAFGTVVKSLVDHVLMPPIGLLVGGVDFGDLRVVLEEATDSAPAVTIDYGLFANNVITFVIVAFATFLLVRAMNTLEREDVAKPAGPPELSGEERLLTEIRDLLAERG